YRVGLVSRRQGGLRKAWRQRLQMGVGVLHGPARLQTAHHRQPPGMANRDAALLVLGKQPVGAQGNRDVEAAPDLHAEKRRRRDADYWNQMTIETDGATQDPGVARELPLPERMAEHDSRAPAGLSIVFCGDCPPYHRTHSQETEKLA